MATCFYPITGGRVNEIVAQQNKSSCSSCLPVVQEQDKFEKFCDTYKGFIDVSTAYEVFFDKWEQAKVKFASTLRAKRTFPIILRVLASSFSGDLFKAFLGKLTWSILVIFSIWFFVFEILGFIKAKDNGVDVSPFPNYEFFLCGGFFATMLLLSLGIQQMGMYSSILGSKVKAALTTAIYKKMIVRDPYDSKCDVVALVAKDVEKIAEACLSLQYLWSGIFETFAVLGVLVILMGTSILPGVGVMLVFLPLQYYMGLVVAFRKKKLSEVSTKRTTLMEEILRSIKLIKIYGWEAAFFKKIHEIRDEEKQLVANINVVQAAIYGLIFSLPPIVSAAVFGTKEATGQIDSVLVFTTLSFFNTLRVPFSKLPKSLRDVLDSFACFERIEDFLLEPELHPELAQKAKAGAKDEHDMGIVFRKASFSYGEGKIVLSDIDLNIPAGSLVMVAGSVASGKSNLLKAILGDLTLRGGSSSESHSRAYVPQVPWTALGTVRENIVFGKPYEEKWYNQVVHACALEPDFKLMPEGDKTWIGERGGNLSGGQKQRIALARAAYSRADLFVLDSPLSAVDMYTCQHIFKFCIQQIMIAGGGTVVLATHQTELFSMSDCLVVMKDGKQAYCDAYRYDGVKHLFPNLVEGKEGTNEDEKKTPNVPHPMSDEQMTLVTNKRSKKSRELKKHLSIPFDDVMPTDALKAKKEQNIYSWYFGKMGWSLIATATLIFVIGQILRVYSDSWVAVWSKRKYTDAGYTSDAFYAGLYGVTVAAFIIISFLRAYWYYYCGRTAAANIHDAVFARVLNAPMHYFHVTPIGKLLTFFTKDINTIDDVLVDNMLLFFILFWILILALCVVAYNLPLFLAIVGGLGVVYVVIVRRFVRSSEPMMKASSEAVGQVVAHTAETLSGLAVVRAFCQQDNFLNENLKFQTRSTVATFGIANLSLWLAFRVDIIGALLVLLCALLALTSDTIDAPIAGLIVSNSFQILLFFSIMSRFMGEVHDNMSAVEQARQMSELPQEEKPEDEEEVPKLWPSNGEIVFDKVVMPYLPGKPPVLKGISFAIRPNEKVGVVGRTGAGKSSLIVALYRLAKIKKGDIEVDGIDCGSVKLHTLRRSMAIIPQEPVMFGGTVRTNLDPFYQHTDEELLDVLQKCLLGPVVKANGGLEAKVEPMGSNYSLGTQQLICLARAMLNPSRILLLDEATAALDSDTNAAVSEVLKEHFSDRTIFTIAHRLDTIIESDRILTVSAGVVAEFDQPDVLIENPESVFHELCMNTGKAQFEGLKEKAKQHATKKRWKAEFLAKTGRDYLEKSNSQASLTTFDTSDSLSDE